MNSVQLIGRLTRDPEVRYTDGGMSIARFSIAVDRRFKQDGGDTADFINCVAFGKTGEFIEKYFTKGKKIALTGRIQTGSYTNKDGAKVFTTDVVTDTVEFVERASDSPQTAPQTASKPSSDGFMNIPDGAGETMPFD